MWQSEYDDGGIHDHDHNFDPVMSFIPAIIILSLLVGAEWKFLLMGGRNRYSPTIHNVGTEWR
jgi:hypothetical protein